MSEHPLFSVVIPAHNQKGRLAATLDSIAAADFDLGRVEVVVVDDGSTDGTYEEFRGRRYPFELRIDRVEHCSQSLATNEAIRRSRGIYVLSSAQDILFDPGMFREHLRWHERFDEDVVVLGYLPYAQHLEITPFMFYLVSGGYQFAYFLIRDPLNVPPNFLYAPNFSVKREVLERVGLFDERFPFGCQDTDLGFRMGEEGIRMVYNRDAVGFHNHPVALDEYCMRQRRVGEATLHLEKKHPGYEGGLAVQDMVIAQYLMFSDAQIDHAWNSVRRLEPGLAGAGRFYRELWNRAFCSVGKLGSLTLEEHRTIQLVEALFKKYQAILGFHWAKGYFAEAIRVDGREAVERWVDARMRKGQASIQVRRNFESRLREHGIERRLFSSVDYRWSKVVYDLESYPSAVRYLDRFQEPPADRCNCELLLVVDPAAFSAEEIAKLGQLAEIVSTPDTDRGVLEAVRRASAESIVVTTPAIEPVHSGTEILVEKLFERIPALAVLGGGVGLAAGERRYGYGATGGPLVEHESPAVGGGLKPVEVANPELCWLRRSTVVPLLERPGTASNGSWNRVLCGLAADGGHGIVHVPELDVRRSEIPEIAGS